MSSNTLNFHFHETFSPQLVYLSELLELASNKYTGDKNEISNLTGIPTGQSSGKVIPHIKYLAYMKLITYSISKNKINLELTDLGKVIYKEDKYLLQDLTKMILHYNISSVINGAPQWCFMFRQFHYESYMPIQINSIENNGLNKFGKNIEIGPIKTLYGVGGDFNSISYIDIKSKEVEFKNSYPLYEYVNCYAYTLLKDWEDLMSEDEITINDITYKLKWNKGFGFDYETTMEVLDDISSKGYIKLNKQLNPVTIIRKCKSNDIINKLYKDII